MKQSQKINLFETRDLGRNIEAALAFAKQNYGAICKGISFFIPLLLIAAYIMPDTFELQRRLSGVSPLEMLSAYGSDTLLAYLAVGLSSLFSMTYVISYMTEYIDAVDGKVDSAAVWSRFSKVIFPVFVCQLVYMICVSVGTMLCLIPGVFIAVSCMFYAYVYINEGETVIGSLKRSYYLVQGNWWSVFLYVLLVVIVVAIISGIFSIPLLFASIGAVFGLDAFASDTYIFITTLIAYVGDFFVAPLVTITLGMLYYSLRDEKEGINMDTKIDDIGINQDNNTNY
ncbi:hypothetical protein [Dysgonomonas sp. ZJ279]|uniref:hypothetical protein n=1 Tax=Dysgonomonas sp. ZJ279 TaxID=2709796 RepID=UPI0013EB8BEB|nr:hypothetical protein [Dysgonomonas sp. ZJ279]